MTRLLIVPRWGGTPADDYYPWLERSLASRDPRPFSEVLTLSMPAPKEPTVAAWSGRVREALGDDRAQIEKTVLLGHSVGCRAVLHALEALPPGVTVAGALLIGAWWTVDAPWESIIPWIEAPLALGRVRAACPKIVVRLSDNDPFTADFQSNKRTWEELLGAEVGVIQGAKHFNASEEPAVLAALLERFA